MRTTRRAGALALVATLALGACTSTPKKAAKTPTPSASSVSPSATTGGPSSAPATTRRPAPAPTRSAASGVPAFDHIVVLVMENHGYGDIIGNPDAAYINGLAARGGLATAYQAVAHPSLPNYLALVGGSTFGITSDCTTCYVSAPNLAADRISRSGRTWRAYQESMPGPCFIGSADPYAQKHNPFIYFDNIRGDPAQCGRIVPYPRLSADFATAASTPNFAFVTPNLCHDMHDCSIATGDQWLSQAVPAILGSPAFTTQNSLLVITWDEAETGGDNRVATLLVGRSVRAGYRSAAPYSHYSLLRTIEAAWSLAPLTSNDAGAAPMTDFFR